MTNLGTTKWWPDDLMTNLGMTWWPDDQPWGWPSDDLMTWWPTWGWPEWIQVIWIIFLFELTYFVEAVTYFTSWLMLRSLQCIFEVWASVCSLWRKHILPSGWISCTSSTRISLTLVFKLGTCLYLVMNCVILGAKTLMSTGLFSKTSPNVTNTVPFQKTISVWPGQMKCFHSR